MGHWQLIKKWQLLLMYVKSIKTFLCLKAASDQANDKTKEEQKIFKMLACERACEHLIAFTCV